MLCVLVTVVDDLSCDVLRWLFRDEDTMENHFKPPYVAPHQNPDPSRIVLQHEVKYTYTQPGK